MTKRQKADQAFIRNGVKLLEAFLMETIKPKPDEVKVYRYSDHGFRIAEISPIWHKKGGGCSGESFERRSECGSTVILAAEDFVLNHRFKAFRPGGWESDLDMFEDAKAELRACLSA